MEKKIFLVIFLLITVLFATKVIAAELTGELNGYYSDTSISTQGECSVEPGATAVLEATSSITINPGFRVRSGGAFYASIGVGRDRDDDNLPDWWELLYWGNLAQGPNDDRDSDQLTNYEEYQNGSLPNDSDTDDDGMPDGWEVLYGLNPLDDSDADYDLDEDGYSNYVEYIGGTNPDDENETPSAGYYNQYDVLGRLTKTVYLSGTQIEYEIEYEYDAVGNRTGKIVR